MNVLLGLVILLVITAISVAAAIMVAVFLGFSSYDESRSGAEQEATLVAQQLQTAQFLPPESAKELTGELFCYARSVSGTEWEVMGEGRLGDDVNPWGVAMFKTVRQVDPRTTAEQPAYDRWMDQTLDREQARVDRVHGAEGIIPLPAPAGPLRDLRRHLRVHAVLRRSGGGGCDPGRAHGQRDCRARAHPDGLQPSPSRRGVGRLEPTAMAPHHQADRDQDPSGGNHRDPPWDEHGSER